MLHRRIKIQLAIFVVVATTAMTIMAVGYIRLPALLFGVGHYTVTVELPEAAGLYKTANVTYRGVEVGRVSDVHLTATGVDAVLSLQDGIDIPSDLDAAVHSQTAIGEQFVALVPRTDTAAPLKNGDVIPRSRTSVPPDINALLDAANTGVQAIPHNNLKTAIDESYLAVGGLGPQLARLIKGSTSLAIDSRENLDALTTLIDKSPLVLDSQTDSGGAIRSWAAHLADITGQLRAQDRAVAGVIDRGGAAADQVRQLLDRIAPTLPVLLANLVSVGKVAVVYRNDLEQLLVLLPQSTQELQAVFLANLNTKQPYKGFYLAFNTNLNLPPPCTTGFLPAQQQRSPTFEDYPDRPAGDFYCRIPQDAPFNVRGARNIPCETVPGKRAPTVKLCESDQPYVPLNNGMSWKGDPNATLSGQDIPQQIPGRAPDSSPRPAAPPLPIAAAQYDPATGTYVGPDGHVYTQSDLAQTAPKERTWQSMLTPSAN
jgi:phospholipid/cholesterol/gamma-HCH transport system substrate-binding protein